MSDVFVNKGAMAATIVVAASDSLNKAAANYVCGGGAHELVICDCEVAWDTRQGANVVCTADPDHQVGTNSAKMAVQAAAGLGLLATHDFTALDLSDHNFIMLWIKHSLGCAAGDLVLHLSSTANCGGVSEEQISLPALGVNVWTQIGIPLANPASDTAIISVGIDLEANDPGAFDLFVDDIKQTWGDDSDIQVAIDALPAGGGIVKLLDGTYNTSAAINLHANTNLIGCGWNTRIVAQADTFDVIYVDENNGLIRDLYIEGANSGDKACIHLKEVMYWHIEDCFITHSGSTGGIFAEGPVGSASGNDWYTGNYILSCNGYGINLSRQHDSHIIGNKVELCDNHLLYSYLTVSCVISSNEFATSTTGDGVSLESSSAMNLIDNWMDLNGRYGIYVYGHENNISHNAVHDNQEHGIYLYHAFKSVISSNVVYSNGVKTADTYDGIHLAEYVKWNIITDNVCSKLLEDGEDYQRAGIGSPTLGQTNLYNLIKNNWVLENKSYALSFALTANAGTNYVASNVGAGPDYELINIYVKNTSGGDLVEGDVVILKAVAAGNEVTTPTAVGQDSVFGMLAEAIVNNAYGFVQVLGKTKALKATNAAANIAIGDFLATEIGNRAALAVGGDMAFAIALEICNDPDKVIDALLIVPRKV